MTGAVSVAERVAGFRQTEEYREMRAGEIVEAVVGSVMRLAETDRAAVTTAVAALQRALSAGAPPVLLQPGDSRAVAEDAELWCALADEREVLALMMAGFHRLRDARVFPRPLAKATLAELWMCLADADRRAFLARVDPRGALRGRG